METQIMKTEKKAINQAKLNCIADYEKEKSISLSSSTINKLRYNKENWLISLKSAQCCCGETSAIDITFFYNNKQYYSLVGYCEHCGDE